MVKMTLIQALEEMRRLNEYKATLIMHNKIGMPRLIEYVIMEVGRDDPNPERVLDFYVTDYEIRVIDGDCLERDCPPLFRRIDEYEAGITYDSAVEFIKDRFNVETLEEELQRLSTDWLDDRDLEILEIWKLRHGLEKEKVLEAMRQALSEMTGGDMVERRGRQS
jgi:hypothetical protein